MREQTEVVIYSVEDQAAFQRKMKRALQKIGFPSQQIVMTFHSDEAIEAYRDEKPHFFFVDINLSDANSELDGFELIEELKRINGGHTIYGMCSGSAEKHEIERAEKLGAKFYIQKTGSTSAFVARLKKWAEIFIHSGSVPDEIQVFKD